MSFIPKTWVDDQIVYAEDMNRIEQGIADSVSFTSQTLTDEQKQRARSNIGAAPSGFGLGIIDWNPAPESDANKIPGTGWFMANKNVPTASGFWLIRHEFDGPSNNDALQTSWPQNLDAVYRGCLAQRYKISGTWSAWEWVNPPMQLGVEYRTTERINGKAVYKQNFNGVIHYRLDGETKWKPYVNVTGGDYRVSSTQELWVSNSGSDTTGDGSQSNPFATIQHAIDSASKNLSGYGLYINLNPGTYNEDVNICGFYGTRGWSAMKIIGGSSIEEAENYKVSSITVEVSISGTVVIEGINFTTSETDMPCITSRGACLSINNCISEAGADRFFSIDSCELGWASIANCRVSNIKEVAILSHGVSIVTVRWCSGSNNAALYKTYYGGIIKLVGTCTWTGTKTWINEAGGNALATGASWIFTATIPASGWIANGVGVTQTLAVSGIRSDDNPIVTDVVTGNQATNMAIKEAWNLVSYILCGDNSITVFCDQGTPEVNIPIQIQCVR